MIVDCQFTPDISLACLADPCYPLPHVLYLLVFSGSLFGIVLLFGARALLRTRAVRRFVRSVKQRFQFAEDRGASMTEEKKIVRPRKNPRASAADMQQVRSLTHMAEKALGLNRIEEAERLFIQALTVQPTAIDVQAQLAKLYLTSGRENKAEAMYKELLTQRDDVSFHANLGLAYYRQEKYVEACQAYQEALNRDPQTPERAYALGRACVAAQRFEEAAPLLEKASARLSKDVDLMTLLADCYLQLGQTDRAEEVYRRINKIQPYNVEVKNKLSSIAKAQV